jgi:hypothetical protein
MPRKPGTILCDDARAPASAAGSLAGDLHDATGHHHYYGSSTVNGGEKIVETRAGRRPRSVEPRGL